MTFVRPEALWLIPVVVGLALWLGRRFDRAGLLRALFVFALALALARPVLLQRADPEMLLVVDVGEPGLSPDAALARVREARASTGLDARLIVYAGMPKLIEPSSNDLALTQALAALATHPGQDPSAALDFAASLAQRDRKTTIRWFSDGHATHGAAEPALLRAAAAAQVEHRLVSARGPERRLRSAGPSAALPGETVEIELVGVGAWPDAVLAFEDALGQRGEVQVPARAEGGFRASFRYEMPLQESALVTAAVRAAGANGEVLAQTRHAILALPRPRVLVVQDPAAPDVMPALQSAFRSAFDLRPVRPEALVRALLDGADALWCADLPARLLDDPTMAAVESAVQRGLPLVLTGGQRSFGPGGYAGTPLEAMLPVRFV